MMMRYLALFTLCLSLSAQADRIKDLTNVAGVRSNQLIGYGLVVGLNGTGDGANISFTGQSLKSMLSRLGVSVDGVISDFDIAGTQASDLPVDNVAAVMVTADLPPFAKPGQTIDVNVSTIGVSESLRGGTLVLTRLRGVDGNVYALAQGALTATGVEVNAAGDEITIGVPTSGRIPNGASVERMVETPFLRSEHVVLNVRSGDFTTAKAIVDKINDTFGPETAQAIDGVSIAVRAPTESNQRVSFVSMVENLEVTPGEASAKVVVNSRTGTVVISRNVRVTAAAVTHGPISVSIAATNEVSQPNPFTDGQTAVVQNADVAIEEPNNKMFLFQPGVDLRDIVDAVNQTGATPSSLIAILEALKTSGSLRAELVVI
ncbi:MAG: flagellar basal body P-ring protein FlgI [Litorivicinaceae bacterium]|jgi:flagellar P-ring protein FlgI|nr:flagellar basal body P-ring protein FlgI [Litorivicinaceae bacterium]MDP5340289.1 flagellar basal body P-ring protein FlgI [Litorivicinaceae bacterium]